MILSFLIKKKSKLIKTSKLIKGYSKYISFEYDIRFDNRSLIYLKKFILI